MCRKSLGKKYAEDSTGPDEYSFGQLRTRDVSISHFFNVYLIESSKLTFALLNLQFRFKYNAFVLIFLSLNKYFHLKFS
jgi:hypothetical protein